MTVAVLEDPVWWVSWFSPEKYGGFELHVPFWRSGWYFTDESEEVTIFVAVVRAPNEDEAFAQITGSYFEQPEGGVSRRYCKTLEHPYPWEREGTRFEREDWMDLP